MKRKNMRRRAFAVAGSLSTGAIIGIAAGSVAVVGTAAVGGVVSTQQKQPLASVYYASDNLLDDLQSVNSASFSIRADGERANGAFAVDYDERTFQFYMEIDDEEIALYYANGKGWAYEYSEYWGKEVYDIDKGSEEAEIFESFFDAMDNKKHEDWEDLIKDTEMEEELEEVIYLNRLNDTAENLQKRMKQSATRKELESALQVQRNGSVYTMELRDDNLIDAIEVVQDIFEEECMDLFREDYGDELLDAFDEIIDDLGEEDFNLGTVEWTTNNKRLQSISVDLDFDDLEEDLSFKGDLNIDYAGSKITGIAASCTFEDYYDKEKFSFELSEINDVDEVIPEDIYDYAS